MLELGTGKTIREEAVERAALNEVPVFEPHRLHVGNAVAAQFAEPEVNTLDRRPAVLEVAVQDDDLATP